MGNPVDAAMEEVYKDKLRIYFALQYNEIYTIGDAASS